MVVNFNEQQTSKLSIGGIRMDSTGLGLARLSDEDFNTAGAIKTIQDGTDASMQFLRSESTSFASSLSIVQARENFTKNLINTLQTGASGLTLADTNEEGANLLALQTRQQLGIQALSIASQSEQSILKLF
jgi:flagellin